MCVVSDVWMCVGCVCVCVCEEDVRCGRSGCVQSLVWGVCVCIRRV